MKSDAKQLEKILHEIDNMMAVVRDRYGLSPDKHTVNVHLTGARKFFSDERTKLYK